MPRAFERLWRFGKSSAVSNCLRVRKARFTQKTNVTAAAPVQPRHWFNPGERRHSRRPPGLSNVLLLLIYKMTATILLPASFVALGAERLLFSVADRLDAAGIDSGRSQRVLDGGGALVSQSEVIFGGAAFVAVSLDGEVDVGMLIKEEHVALNRTLLVAADVRLIVVKVNILDALSEQSLIS